MSLDTGNYYRGRWYWRFDGGFTTSQSWLQKHRDFRDVVLENHLGGRHQSPALSSASAPRSWVCYLRWKPRESRPRARITTIRMATQSCRNRGERRLAIWYRNFRYIGACYTIFCWRLSSNDLARSICIRIMSLCLTLRPVLRKGKLRHVSHNDLILQHRRRYLCKRAMSSSPPMESIQRSGQSCIPMKALPNFQVACYGEQCRSWTNHILEPEI